MYKEVDRPTHDSIKREQALTKVTNDFMTQYRIPTDTNALKDYLLVHDSLEGFDMDKDYTNHYRQEDVFKGLEETVKSVESPFHEW